MAKRKQSLTVDAVVMILFPVVLAAAVLGTAYYVGYHPRPAKPVKTAAEYRRQEIEYLEQMLREDIDKARQEGKTDAEIEQMKAKYQASIDRIKAEDEGKSH